MAAELQPPDSSTSAATTTVVSTTTIPTETAAPPPPTTIVQSEPDNAGPSLAPKRQRRPSVRLGEIGEQPATLSYESNIRRTKHPWRLPRDSSSSGPHSKSLKARSLTNLVNGAGSLETQDNEDKNPNGDSNFEFVLRKGKAKRGTIKRPRSNWASKFDEGVEEENRDNGDEGFRETDPDSGSPMKDQSPVNSADNAGIELWPGQRRPDPGRSRENDGVEGESRDRDGVRSWLIELGLSRYAPVFEIHEVDEEVLPLLTLEDLKDMGINAVGSRRKLYAAIEKLRMSFS